MCSLRFAFGLFVLGLTPMLTRAEWRRAFSPRSCPVESFWLFALLPRPTPRWLRVCAVFAARSCPRSRHKFGSFSFCPRLGPKVASRSHCDRFALALGLALRLVFLLPRPAPRWLRVCAVFASCLLSASPFGSSWIVSGAPRQQFCPRCPPSSVDHMSRSLGISLALGAPSVWPRVSAPFDIVLSLVPPKFLFTEFGVMACFGLCACLPARPGSLFFFRTPQNLIFSFFLLFFL